MQTLVAQVVLFYFFGEQGEVEHIRSVGNVLYTAVIVEDVDAVIRLVVHILFDAGGGDKIVCIVQGNIQLLADLQA